MAAPCKKLLVQTTLFIDRPFIMTCIWRIHGSKPYIVRWSLVYNTSVFCFSHFHLEGWVGGLSQMKLTSFEKNCRILRRSLTLHDAISCETSYVFVVLMIIRFPVFLFLELIATFFHTDVSNLQGSCRISHRSGLPTKSVNSEK